MSEKNIKIFIDKIRGILYLQNYACNLKYNYPAQMFATIDFLIDRGEKFYNNEFDVSEYWVYLRSIEKKYISKSDNLNSLFNSLDRDEEAKRLYINGEISYAFYTRIPTSIIYNIKNILISDSLNNNALSDIRKNCLITNYGYKSVISGWIICLAIISIIKNKKNIKIYIYNSIKLLLPLLTKDYSIENINEYLKIFKTKKTDSDDPIVEILWLVDIIDMIDNPDNLNIDKIFANIKNEYAMEASGAILGCLLGYEKIKSFKSSNDIEKKMETLITKICS